jgi:hypothetical protein
MKKFSQFIIEAKETRASEQAKNLGLVGNGHGDWYNTQGEFVAKTVDGQLKFFTKGQRLGKRDIPPKPGGAQKAQPSAQSQTQPQQTSSQQVLPQRIPVGQEEEMPGEDEFLTVVFGYFNPPTKEHKKLFSTAKRVSLGGEIRIYPSRTQDNKKNPLNPNRKIYHLKKMFPEIKDDVVNNPEMNTIFDVLIAANEDGYSNVNIVVGSDRQSEVQSLANKYNGKLYQFNEIVIVPSGNFDAEKNTSGISSGMLRKSAAENNIREFARGIPKTYDNADTKKLFDEIRKAMGFKNSVKEEYNLWEIAPSLDFAGLRENYVQNNIFKLGDLVENINTGLVGKVIRRGTNYLICVTEDEVMFKTWITDVMEAETEVPSTSLKKLVKKAVNRKDSNIDGFVDKEDSKIGPYGAFIPQARNVPKNFREEYQEKKVERKMRVPGKPNTLVGTGGYFKYAVDMTPGFEKGDSTNLQPGAKPYSGYKQIKEFINKYKVKK